MPLRTCDVQGCANPAERDRGNCMICSAHRCLAHLSPEFHSCPNEATDADAYFTAYDSAKDLHFKNLVEKINFVTLAALAERLHDNDRCRIPAVWYAPASDLPNIDFDMIASQTGGQNCHVDIQFDDGTIWIARLRLDDPLLPPTETQNEVFASEVSTLQFLSQTQVPVPEVFYHTFDSSAIGTPVVLMRKLPGNPLNWSSASVDKKTKVMEQLADIFLEIEKHPLHQTGSLVSGTGEVGPFAQMHMFSTPSQSIGPGNSAKDAITAVIQHEIGMIESGEMSSFPVDNYLTHVWRLENVDKLALDSDAYYLKHFDDKGDHILVDEDYNITGIIDWEFASLEPKTLAFSSPCMMWPVGHFYDGKNCLSEEEIEFAEIFRRRGREDMAKIVLNGRKVQRFMFFLGSAVSSDRAEFVALFQGLRLTFDDGQEVGLYAEWRAATIERLYESDGLLRRLVENESHDNEGEACRVLQLR